MDYINVIETEMLDQVFAMLSFDDQLAAMTTCNRWFQILSSKRYLKNSKFLAVPYFEEKLSAEDVKYYPVVEVGKLSCTCNGRVVSAIRDFLSREDVSRNLQELDVNGFNRPLAELFGDVRFAPMHFPNLQKLRMCVRYLDRHETAPIVAPKLNCVEMNSLEGCYTGDMALSYVEQLRELNVRFGAMDGAILALCGESYDHLRHLTLDSAAFFCDEDIETLKRTVRGVTHLNIKSNDGSLLKILPAARNVQVLNVWTINIDFHYLSCLESVTELSMIGTVSFEECNRSSTITLPNLVKLTLGIAQVPKFVVPKLRSLHLTGVPSLRQARLCEQSMATFLGTLCNQLVEFKISDAGLCSGCADQIRRNMTQLRCLRFNRVTVKPIDVGMILNWIKTLKRADFSDCKSRTCHHQNKTFYRNLNRKHRHCDITFSFTQPPRTARPAAVPCPVPLTAHQHANFRMFDQHAPNRPQGLPPQPPQMYVPGPMWGYGDLNMPPPMVPAQMLIGYPAVLPAANMPFLYY